MRRRTGLAFTTASVVLAGSLLGIAAAADAVPAAAAAPCVPGATYGNPLPSATLAATKIRDGFNFLEGPVWDSASGTLFLSNMQNATGPERVQPSSILRFTPPATFETFIAAGGSNGLALSNDGSTILAATHDQRSVSSYRISDRSRGVVAATFNGHKFNSPNDLTVAADGSVYFTDPNFQRGNRADELSGKTGVYRVVGGVVRLVDDTVKQPNGIALSPDGKTLYVGANAENVVYSYPVAADGSVGARTRFAAFTGPDGDAVDCAGNIYWVSYNEGRVHVFTPAGRELGTISAGLNITNVAFGGDDHRTLYLTSGTPSSGGTAGNFGLYSIRLNVPGYPY